LEDRLLVGIERLPLARLRDLDAPLVLARVEDGLEEVSDDVPGLAGAFEEVVEVRAREAERPGQGDAREEERLRLADVRGRGSEDLLGLTDVRAPVEERRGEAGGDGAGKLLLVEGATPEDRARVAAEEDGELVLLEPDEAAEVEDDRLDALELGL